RAMNRSLALMRKAVGEKHGYVMLPLIEMAIVEEKAAWKEKTPAARAKWHADALKHYGEAYQVGKESVGLTHPRMLPVAGRRAAPSRLDNKPEKASALLEEILAANRERYGEHPSFADALLLMARHQRESNDRVKAHEAFEQAEKIYAKFGRVPRRHAV